MVGFQPWSLTITLLRQTSENLNTLTKILSWTKSNQQNHYFTPKYTCSEFGDLVPV